MKWLIVCIFVFSMMPALLFGQTVIINSQMNGTVGYVGEGPSSVATIGETFRVPNSQVPVLDAVSTKFFTNGCTYNFNFYVYRWGGTKLIGDCLFQSTPQTAEYRGGLGFDWTINPRVSLQTGVDYVWFITSSGLFDGITDRTSLGSTGVNTYTDGKIVWANNYNDFSKLFTENWWVSPGAGYVQDLGFQMVFTPEPATLLLLGLGGMLLRKHKNR
jgi:hypothetical protein